MMTKHSGEFVVTTSVGVDIYFDIDYNINVYGENRPATREQPAEYIEVEIEILEAKVMLKNGNWIKYDLSRLRDGLFKLLQESVERRAYKDAQCG